MKTIAWLGLAGAALAATPALAADLGRSYYAPAPYSAFSWAGPYVGANLGYQFGSVTNSGADPGGFAGGVTVGYNWQSGQFVYGVEGDIDWSSADDTSGGNTFSTPWYGTVRGRLGYGMSNVLLYGTGGFAFGEGKLQNFFGTEDHSAFGWTLGVGGEVGLGQHWSAKAEYLFIKLDDERYTFTGADHAFENNLLRFGLNYHF